MELINGDCLEVLKSIEAESIDAIVTDPPAGIAFMGKAWDKDKGGRDHWIVWMASIAAECLRVLKPGGHALVWALPRTSHWTATAWENAGFEVRDRISHAFGSGFPKSHNIGKAVDKLQGNEREVSKVRTDGAGNGNSENVMYDADHKFVATKVFNETVGTSEWEGWGTALKPAVELWIKLKKPFTSVSLYDILPEITNQMEAILWGLSPAKFVEKVLKLNSQEQGMEGEQDSARWIAAAWNIASQHGSKEVMDTFNSQEEAETFWSIALLWRAILIEVYYLESKYTISTETRLTTELKTLNCYISGIIPEHIIRGVSRQNGLLCNAWLVENHSSDCNALSMNTQTHFAVKNVMQPVLNLLVSAAEGLSIITEVKNGVIVPEGAITGRQVRIEDYWLLRKPLSEKTVAQNVLKHGCGGINIDKCRIRTDESLNGGINSGSAGIWSDKKIKPIEYKQPSGRFPANFIHDGSDEIVNSFPVTTPTGGGRKGEMGPRTYLSTSKSGSLSGARGGLGIGGKLFWDEERQDHYVFTVKYPDTGSAARYFYCAKASKRDRDEGCEGNGEKASPIKNFHPTVKATPLMQYLCRMITRPGGTILDPFMGSGSTGKAAILEGFNFIGIELEKEYFDIAEARIKHAMNQHQQHQFELLDN